MKDRFWFSLCMRLGDDFFIKWIPTLRVMVKDPCLGYLRAVWAFSKISFDSYSSIVVILTVLHLPEFIERKSN